MFETYEMKNGSGEYDLSTLGISISNGI